MKELQFEEPRIEDTTVDTEAFKKLRIERALRVVEQKLLKEKNPLLTVLEAAAHIGISEKTFRNKSTGKNRIISTQKQANGDVMCFFKDADAYKKLKTETRIADIMVVRKTA